MTDPHRTETDVRAVLAALEPCDPDCPGWCLMEPGSGRGFGGVELQRCDACCAGTELEDTDMELLPEARAALEAKHREYIVGALLQEESAAAHEALSLALAKLKRGEWLTERDDPFYDPIETA